MRHGLFDEISPMLHSSRTMRLLRILLVLIVTSGSPALAQTNAPEVRKLSLADCIAIAVQHNFDVQIRRYDPELARFTLASQYGVYDPNFSIAGEHDYNRAPGGIDPQGRPFGGTETEANRLSSSLQGLLPWGTSYTLGGNMTDTYGTRPVLAQGPVTGFTTNVVFDSFGAPIGFTVDPVFSATTVREPFENVVGSMGLFQLRQPLLKNFWIDSTRLQIYIDKKQIRISEQDLRSQLMISITAVEREYFNLIAAQEFVRVQQKALELAERLLSETKKRVEVGALAPLDERQAESQAAKSRADLINAQGIQDTQQRTLKRLLSDNYDDWGKVYIQPSEALVALPESYNLQESWRTGLRQRPELVQQRLRMEQQNYRIRFQHNQLFPQVDLVGTGGYNASSASLDTSLDQLGSRDNPFYSVGGQLTIPLSRRTARNDYKSAKATREQMELQLKQLEQNALIEIEESIALANTDFQQVGARREATKFAEEALDAEQKKLESGKSTSFFVLQLQSNLTQARSDEIRALADYNNALAAIALSEGTTLERRNVKLEFKP
jgi:outer membrane protein TolC